MIEDRIEQRIEERMNDRFGDTDAPQGLDAVPPMYPDTP